ncbi:MAG TPA: hypothetical protein VK897_13370 [Anaerolineales bacterium]|nr:hypothetical protein [Anaerolineales bacterium]
MGKYTSYARQKPKPRNVGVHPVMRGIGCIMMVVVPILAYGLSILVVNYGVSRGWPLPANWFGPPSIPPLLWRVQGLQPILQFLQAQNNLEVNLVFTIVLIVIIGGIMTLIYGYMYTLFGPPKYGPQDAPPIRVKVKRYKR